MSALLSVFTSQRGLTSGPPFRSGAAGHAGCVGPRLQLIQSPSEPEPGLAQGKGMTHGRGASRTGRRIRGSRESGWPPSHPAAPSEQRRLVGAGGGRRHPGTPLPPLALRLLTLAPHPGARSESTRPPALRSPPDRAADRANAPGQPLLGPCGAPGLQLLARMAGFCSQVCPFGLSPIMGPQIPVCCPLAPSDGQDS